MAEPVPPSDAPEAVFGPALVRKMTTMRFSVSLRRPSSHGWTLIAAALGAGWILAGGRVKPAVLGFMLSITITYLEQWLKIRNLMARDFCAAGTGTTLFAVDEVVFTEANICTRVRYDGISRLWVFGEGVVFTQVGLFGATTLPAQLIPPGGLARLAAGAEARRSATSSVGRVEPLGDVDSATRTFVADRRTVARLCRASPDAGGRRYWTRMAGLALWGVIISAAWWSSQGRPDREFVLLLGIWLIALGLRVIRDRQRLRRAMIAAYAPGRVLVTHFDAWGMTIVGEAVSMTLQYTAFDRIDVVNGVVMLRAPRHGTVMLPPQLVPDRVVTHLRTVIGSDGP